jgi:peptidoglycan/LPS O-acetylase OafA/YrhL
VNKQTNCFDFLRLFAATCVLIGHSVTHLNISFLWLTNENGYWFYDGVPMFFILSGYLIYNSYEKCVDAGKTSKDFYFNRFLRIVPAIYIYLIVVCVFLYSVNIIDVSKIASKSFIAWFVSNLSLIPVYHPSIFKSFGVGILNGSLWTIPAEVSFYVIVPLIYLIGKKFGLKRMSFIFASIALVGKLSQWWLLQTNPDSMFTKLFGVTFAPYLIYFGLGILYTKLWVKMPQNKFIVLISFVVYVLIRYNIAINFKGLLGGFYEVIYVLPLSYCIMWFGYNAPKVLNKLTNKIGDLSYSTYIWHMIVINSYIYFNVRLKLSILPNSLIHILALLTTYFIAWLSWNLVEKQFLKKKRFTSNSSLNIKRIIVH